MILPKRGRVHVGKRLEFVYKTVTILQMFRGREKFASPLLCLVELIIEQIAIKNNDRPKLAVMKLKFNPLSGLSDDYDRAGEDPYGWPHTSKLPSQRMYR
jgi:hypothetical protein